MDNTVSAPATTTTTSPSPKAPRRIVGSLAAVLLAILATFSLAQPASALSSITPPGGFQCERYDNKLSVSPPRVWASNRTEQVGWGVDVQRWNGSSWVLYSRNLFYSSFNVFGQSMTSWTGGWYANSTMNIPVSHRGYYRLSSAVMGNQGGATWQGLVDGGAYCYVY